MVSLSFTEEISERLIREANEMIEKCGVMGTAKSTLSTANTTNANTTTNTSRNNTIMDGKCAIGIFPNFTTDESSDVTSHRHNHRNCA